MKTRTYWQSVDKDRTGKTFWDNKPTLERGTYTDGVGDWCEHFIFPIQLKTLQIAEITVNENGTWSYEIEREEGWYMALYQDKDVAAVVQYKNGKFTHAGGKHLPIDLYTISKTRIPDECII